MNNCVSTVEELLDAGVSPESTDEQGHTALIAAAWRGHAEVARILLDAGADPTASRGNWSALCWGSWHADVTRLYLERGLLRQLEDSCPYLHNYSAQGEDGSLIPDLLALGFDLEEADAGGYTPLATAVRYRNYPIIQALLEAGARADPSLIFRSDSVATCLLLRSGADPNAWDAKGFTPLMNAARGASEWNLRLLLGEGADPDLQDSEGQTALMHALTGDLQLQHSRVRAEAKEALALLLLKAGADPTIRDNEGRNALDYAETHGHRKAAALLRESLQPTTR